MTDDARVTLSRIRGIKPLVRLRGAVLYGQPLYCMSCARQDGYVTVGLPDGVVYVCDRCEAAYGVHPALLPRPDLDQAKVPHAVL